MRRPVPNPALPMAMQPRAALRGLNPLPTPGFSGRAGGAQGCPPFPALQRPHPREQRPCSGWCDGCCGGRRWDGGSRLMLGSAEMLRVEQELLCSQWHLQPKETLYFSRSYTKFQKVFTEK